MLLADDGSAFAQSSGASRELPPIQVSGGETTPHKRLPASRRASKPVLANRRHVAQPTQAPASDARSVASGAEGPPGMASEITVSGDEINARPSRGRARCSKPCRG